MQNVVSETFGVAPAILIIESFSSDGLDEPEATRLAPALSLARIPFAVGRPNNEAELAASLHVFAQDIKNRRVSSLPVVPTVHFAAHGREDGVVFAFGCIPWRRLRDHLLAFARECGRLNHKGLALVEVCMSTCKGLHAAEMFELGPPFPCVAVIGSLQDVWSGDTLDGFRTYYSRLATRPMLAIDAVREMNNVVGSEVFGCVVVPNVTSQFQSLHPRAGP